MAKNAAKMMLNNLPKLKQKLSSFTDKAVFVGVPHDNTARKGDEPSSEPNNAQLAFIHDNGSPAANIPPRPFMKPGIKAVQGKIARILKQGVMKGEQENALHMAGLLAQNSVRKAINDGPPPPLKESTLVARRRRGRTGTKPLIDTGQLRNSIIYVIMRK